MRFSVIFYILSLFFLVSCDSDLYVWPLSSSSVAKGDVAKRTLFVYMMAENSLSGYAANDDAEIKKGISGVPDNCRVFAFIDDDRKPRVVQYVHGESGGESVVVEEFEVDICSSDAGRFAKVLEALLLYYPTESLDVVLWSHGDGWLAGSEKASMQRSIGIDNEKNSYSDISTKVMEMKELASVLEALPVRVDRLLFDACFMQCVEVAYDLRNSANWIIASPAEIPANGAPYDKLLPLFFDEEASVGDIVRAYVDAYESEECGVVLSVVCTEAMDGLAKAMEGYVCKYFPVNENRDYSTIFSYLPGGKRTLFKVYPCYYDFDATMQELLSAQEYGCWSTAFKKAVPYVAFSNMWYSSIIYRKLWVDPDVCSGMSMYIPQAANAELNSNFLATGWYSAAGWCAAGW